MKIYRTRTSDITVPLTERTNGANTAKVALLVSLHANGSTYSSARGFDSHIYPTAPQATRDIQDIFQSKLGALFVKWGSKDRGKKENNFHMVRESNMRAILLENGFMTSPEDRKLHKNAQFMDELASEIAVCIEMSLDYLDADSVWIDEGHGGKYSGAVAPDGEREADFNLMLSNLVVEKLQKKEVAQSYIVTKGDTMNKIASNNNISLDKLAEYNPHIADLGLIYVGDIVYLNQSNDLEIKYAQLNRELILIKEEKDKLEKQNANLLAEKKKLISDLAKSQDAIQQAKNTTLLVQQELAKKNEELAQLEKDNETLRQTIEQKNAKIAELKKENEIIDEEEEYAGFWGLLKKIIAKFLSQ